MYKTKQKTILIDYFKKNISKQLSINEIISSICPDGSGKSTIYRRISKMVEDGELLRLHGDDGKSIVYQYTGDGMHCSDHFHLKCSQCGKLVHLDCEHLTRVSNHILAGHNFTLDTKKSVLYGLCSQCR